MSVQLNKRYLITHVEKLNICLHCIEGVKCVSNYANIKGIYGIVIEYIKRVSQN